MKPIGVLRKVDELGRIVIPMELRRTLEIRDRQPLDFYVEKNSIILSKHEFSCVFCGGKEAMARFRGKQICLNCLNDINEIFHL